MNLATRRFERSSRPTINRLMSSWPRDVGETARLLSLSVPQVTGQAEMITGSANDAAQRILALVKERVA